MRSPADQRFARTQAPAFGTVEEMVRRNDDTRQVLVIDDSIVARTAMIEALSAAGIPAAGLPGPIGATREILRRRVRVVVVDVNMPAMQGDKLVDLFRRNPRFDHLKVILTSGMPANEFREVARESLADHIVPKQEDLGPLVKAISDLLEAANTNGDSGEANEPVARESLS